MAVPNWKADPPDGSRSMLDRNAQSVLEEIRVALCVAYGAGDLTLVDARRRVDELCAEARGLRSPEWSELERLELENVLAPVRQYIEDQAAFEVEFGLSLFGDLDPFELLEMLTPEYILGAVIITNGGL